MQHDLEKLDKRPKNNVPRAKMFLRARLGWLWGYPVAVQGAQVQWQSFYYPLPWDVASSAIGTEQLAEAAFAYTRLKNQFPRALPAVVGDVEVWAKRVSLKLHALRQLMDGDSVDPWQHLFASEQGMARLQRQAEALKQQAPLLAALVDGFAWWLSLEPTALQQGIEWLQAQAPQLTLLVAQAPDERTGITMAMSLFALTQTVPLALVNELMQIIAHRIWAKDGMVTYKALCQEYYGTFEQCAFGFNGADAFAQELADAQSSFAPWLVKITELLQAPAREQRRSVDLTLQLLPPAVLTQWQVWLEAAHTYLRHYRAEAQQEQREQAAIYQAVQKQYLKQTKEQRVKRLQPYWQALATHTPLLTGERDAIFNLLAWYGERPAYLKVLQQWQSLAEHIAAESVWRRADASLVWASHWHAVSQYYGTVQEQRYLQILQAWLSYLQQAQRQGRLEIALQPWLKLWDHYGRVRPRPHPAESLECELLSYHFLSQQHHEFFHELTQLLQQPFVSSANFTALAYDYFHMIWYMPTHWPRVAYFAILQQHSVQLGRWFYNFDWLGGLLQVDPSPEHFLQLVRTWQLTHSDEQPPNQAAAMRVAAWLVQQGYVELAVLAQQQQAWAGLAAMRPFIERFERLNVSLPKPPLVEGECSVYPEFALCPATLQPALQLLVRYHPQPVQAAQKILAAQFPSTEAIQREIAAIQAKLDSAALTASQPLPLRQRLANLEQRLQQPLPVSEQRLAYLAHKLKQAAVTGVLQQWLQVCIDSFEGQLRTCLAVDSFDPTWLANKMHRQTLIGLAGLQTQERQLASVLLNAEREGRYPLHELPANQAWIAAMQAKGIQLEIWLSRFEFKVVQTTAEGDILPLTFRFADRLFDVLQMGDHFDTCLSHDGCNFFSVLANAADVNKRVLYAYDEQGRVKGRCLVAISDEGHLLHFHPYTHLSPAKLFQDGLQSVISALEQRLGIRRHQQGKVAQLVAKRWYDDGVATLDVVYPCFAKSHPFRKSLAYLAAEDILPALQQALAPEPVHALVVYHLLRLKELQQRPPALLLVGLQAQQQGWLDATTRRQLVKTLLEQAVPAEQVWPLAGEALEADIQAALQRYDWLDLEMGLLVAMQPQSALRLLRHTKQRFKRIHEWYWVNRVDMYQAQCLLALQRPRQALEICLALEKAGVPNEALTALRLACEEQLA